MSPRILIQKTDLRDLFRRTNPATRKSSPNLLGAYMRRAVSLTANLLGSTTTASAGVVSILAALAATCLVFLLRASLLGGDCLKLGFGHGILPASLVSRVVAHYVNSGGRVYLGLGDSFLLGREGTEVLLVSRLAGNIWGLWIAGFAKRFTRSSGMALSSTRACALTWLESSPPEGVCDGVVSGVITSATCRGPQLGELSGAIESVARGLGVSHIFDACGWGRLGFSLPLGTSRLLRGVRSFASALGFTIVTWLILQ
ncbi:hypothetical protein EJ07DRAFT_160672 [Lizonia empirigonia]|nr:hypothetical protein EJ07DRAFT_160672 [Lizonia empirigonia]